MHVIKIIAIYEFTLDESQWKTHPGETKCKSQVEKQKNKKNHVADFTHQVVCGIWQNCSSERNNKIHKSVTKAQGWTGSRWTTNQKEMKQVPVNQKAQHSDLVKGWIQEQDCEKHYT